MARQLYKDYDETMSHYADVARTVPGLAAAIDASAAPGISAYQAIQAHLNQQALKDPETLEARVQARVQEELAKMKGAIAAEGLPKSITSARGSGGGTQSAWTGPKPLHEILKKR
jgi:hypothetical protein